MSDIDDEPLTPEESAQLRAVTAALVANRQSPRAAFRGRLQRRLIRHGVPSARPRNLPMLIAAFAVPGALLLALAAAGALGAGPLAP
jgi:hypothetical protein